MRRNVLVVDDDKHIQTLVQFFLEQSGFVVQICKDGFSALDELKANPYDLVILDISMPHMNGFKTLKAMREHPDTAALPVLMLTSSQDKNDIVKAKSQNVTDYIIKPPVREDFMKRVERILGGRPQYEEITFTPEDTGTSGTVALPFHVKSISRNGIVLVADTPMIKGQSIDILKIELFDKIGISKRKFVLSECAPTADGKFDYFFSFIGIDKQDQDKLREWITAQTFERRNDGRKTS